MPTSEQLLQDRQLLKARKFVVRVPSIVDPLIGVPVLLRLPIGTREYQVLPPIMENEEFYRLMMASLFIFERCLPQWPRRKLEAMCTSTIYRAAAEESGEGGKGVNGAAGAMGPQAPLGPGDIDYGRYRLMLVTDIYVSPKGVARTRVLGAASFCVCGGGTAGVGGGGAAAVTAFATEPDFHHCGNGRLLWTVLQTTLRQVGVRSILLPAFAPDNESCERFWRRRKFRRVLGGKEPAAAAASVAAVIAASAASAAMSHVEDANREIIAAGGTPARADSSGPETESDFNFDFGDGDGDCDRSGECQSSSDADEDSDGQGSGAPEPPPAGMIKLGVAPRKYDGPEFWRHQYQQDLSALDRVDVRYRGVSLSRKLQVAAEEKRTAEHRLQLRAESEEDASQGVSTDEGAGFYEHELGARVLTPWGLGQVLNFRPCDIVGGDGGSSDRAVDSARDDNAETGAHNSDGGSYVVRLAWGVAYAHDSCVFAFDGNDLKGTDDGSAGDETSSSDEEDGQQNENMQLHQHTQRPRRPRLMPPEMQCLGLLEQWRWRDQTAEPILIRRFVGQDCMSIEEACLLMSACRIQGMWRMRIARRRARALCNDVYERYYDEELHSHFWYNKRYRESRWTKPRIVPDMHEVWSDFERAMATKLQQQFRSRRSRRKFVQMLLDVWEKQWDGQRGMYMYINKLTGLTVWKKPKSLRGAEVMDVADAGKRRLAEAKRREAKEAARRASIQAERRRSEIFRDAIAGSRKRHAQGGARMAVLQGILDEEAAHFWYLMHLSLKAPYSCKHSTTDDNQRAAGSASVGLHQLEIQYRALLAIKAESKDTDNDHYSEEKRACYAVQEAIEMLKPRPQLATVPDPAFGVRYPMREGAKRRAAQKAVHRVEARIKECLERDSEVRSPKKGPDLSVYSMEGGGVGEKVRARMRAHSVVQHDLAPVAAYPLHFLCADQFAMANAVAYTIECFPDAVTVDDVRSGLPPLHLVMGNPAVTLEMINELMEAGAHFDKPDTRGGRLPLHVLCDNTSISPLLLNYVIEAAPGAASTRAQITRHLSATQTIQNTRFAACYPLHILCRNPAIDHNLWRRMLSAYPDAQSAIAREGTMLHFACANTSITDTLLETIIDQCPKNLKAADELDGKNPLHNLCLNPAVNRDMLERVVDAYPEACGFTRGGYSPLQCLCLNPSYSIDMMGLLIDSAPLSVHVETHCDAALFLLCANPSITRHALERLIGARPKSVFFEYNGETPLHRLVENPSLTVHMLRFLVDAHPGAASQMEQYTGRYPLHRLCGNPALDPEWLDVVLRACPTAACKPIGTTFDKTDSGMYPIHRLCGNKSLQRDWALLLLNPLVDAFPGALSCRDCHNKLPIHYFLEQARERGEVLEAVDNNSFYYRDTMLAKLKRITTLPLRGLTIMDVVNMLDGLDLFKFCRAFYRAGVTGADLYNNVHKLCDEHEIYGPFRIKLCDAVAEYRDSGVPLRVVDTKEYKLNYRKVI